CGREVGYSNYDSW
nr:immunoglobulin heavy chain junction region [Macaca mulatta]MOW91529.1 immunoglobulin heavy chain junction region [Macaca mulatta]